MKGVILAGGKGTRLHQLTKPITISAPSGIFAFIGFQPGLKPGKFFRTSTKFLTEGMPNLLERDL